jgi:hypothetical protein
MSRFERLVLIEVGTCTVNVVVKDKQFCRLLKFEDGV